MSSPKDSSMRLDTSSDNFHVMQTLFLSNLRCGDHGFDALDTLSHPVVLSEDYHAIATAPQRARHRLLDTLILKELVRLLKKDAIYLASDYAASFRVRPPVASGAAIDLTIPDWCYSPGRALLISLQASFARHDAETIQVIRARLYDTTIAQVSGDVELLQRKTQTDLQLLLAAHKAARRPSDHVESDLADHIVTMFGHYDRQLYGPTCDHLRMTEESIVPGQDLSRLRAPATCLQPGLLSAEAWHYCSSDLQHQQAGPRRRAGSCTRSSAEQEHGQAPGEEGVCLLHAV